MSRPFALAFVLVLVACGSTDGAGDAGRVTELPDGAPCGADEQYCGGGICQPLANSAHCGACGNRCPIAAPTCVLRSGAYVCIP